MTRSAYRNVLREWSAEEAPGETVAIMAVRASGAAKQSLRMSVSLLPRYGMCLEVPSPKARMHSLSANKLVLMSALSARRWALCDDVSLPRSLPAKSTKDNLPYTVELGLVWPEERVRDPTPPPPLAVDFLKTI